MAIKELARLLVPPKHPTESGVGEKWPLIEDKLSFPPDYIDFIHTYGSGRIADFIVIFNPFSKNEYVNFFEQFCGVLASFNELIVSDEDYYKFRLYPKDNGLIPVGVTDNGDDIFWVMNAKENSELWRTAIIPARSPDVEYFDCGLIALLENLLNRRIKAKPFPDSFPDDVITFESI